MQRSKLNNTTDSLSSKVFNGAFWTFLFQVVDNLLGFIRLLILARLLTPNDLGLVAIAWLILQTIAVFTQTGVHQSLIHKSNIERYLNTAWTYLFFRGIFLYLILYFIAPILGSFFNANSSILIIRVISLTLIFEGFSNIGTIYFQKNMHFNKQFWFQIGGNIVDFIVAVTLAFILKDVWAIIYASLANSFVRFILSYLLSSYRPKLEFDINIFKEINNYGKWIAGSNILQFIYSQGDDLLVGKILGPTSLGLYQLAYKISNLPATQITHIISVVMFPAYSTVQNNLEKLKIIYLKTFQVTLFLSFYVGSGIILFSEEFVILFLGDKWLPIVTAMKILTIWGLLRSIAATTGPIWQALGTPKIMTKIQFLHVIILSIIIVPLTLYMKIEGTAWAVVISSVIPYAIAIYKIARTINSTVWELISSILIPLIISIVSIIVFNNLYFLFKNTNILLFIVTCLLFTIFYMLSVYIVDIYLKLNIYKYFVMKLKSTSFFSKFNI